MGIFKTGSHPIVMQNSLTQDFDSPNEYSMTGSPPPVPVVVPVPVPVPVPVVWATSSLPVKKYGLSSVNFTLRSSAIKKIPAARYLNPFSIFVFIILKILVQDCVRLILRLSSLFLRFRCDRFRPGCTFYFNITIIVHEAARPPRL